MSQDSTLVGRVLELRTAFDEAFARPLAVHEHNSHDYLRFMVSGTSYAISVRHIAGVALDVEWTLVPSSLDEFLGLTCLRGKLVPIYDLGKILGHGAAKDVQGVLLSAQAPLGFTFSQMIGLERILSDRAQSDEIPAVSSTASILSSQEVIQCRDGERVAVLEISSLLDRIGQRITSNQRRDG